MVKNTAFSGAEGVGFGVLGVGLPDIAVFTSVILRGAYEIALCYGFDYTSDGEKFFVLKLIETAALKEDLWEKSDAQIDEFIALGGLDNISAQTLKK